jgi:hypothetical protein
MENETLSYTAVNQTISAIEAEIEARNRANKRPSYRLGMGVLGSECERSIFYAFRGVLKPNFSAQTLRIFQDGHHQEAEMAGYLKLMPFIQLFDRDPQNPTQQIACEGCAGHLKGYLDGMIKGILEAPATWHVWEHKCVNDKKFDELEKLKDSVGEKNAFREWDFKYYIQGMMYCMKQAVPRHYLTVSTPGGRRWTSCRTNANDTIAHQWEEIAGNIIFSNTIPNRIADKPESFKCRFCDYSRICHHADIPLVSCKTCLYRQPVMNGEFMCQKRNEPLDKMALDTSCDNHLFLPQLLSAIKTIEVFEDFVLYENESGVVFANTTKTSLPDRTSWNGKEIKTLFTSSELYEKIKNVRNLASDTVAQIQQGFSGEIELKGVKAWDETKTDISDEVVEKKTAKKKAIKKDESQTEQQNLPGEISQKRAGLEY